MNTYSKKKTVAGTYRVAMRVLVAGKSKLLTFMEIVDLRNSYLGKAGEANENALNYYNGRLTDLTNYSNGNPNKDIKN
jgi:hypothetical protein